MQTYGEWLERMHAPNLRACQLKDLAMDAAFLLGLKINFQGQDLTIDKLNELDKKLNYTEELLKNSLRLFKPIRYQIDEIQKIDNEDINNNEMLRQLYKTGNYITCMIGVSLILKYIYKQNKPWEHVIYDLKTSSSSDEYMKIIRDSLQVFITSYGCVSDTLVIENEKVTKIPSISGREGENIYPIPWNILISRIFFNFLFLGGQDYFGFCEHCDKFFLVQRKGRKKYCSDSCRAQASKIRSEHNLLKPASR